MLFHIFIYICMGKKHIKLNNSTEKMNRECISVSFVAVFSQALPGVPALENKFCRELFGMPYDTFNGLTNEGYVIALENKPMPSIIITPQKIVFKAQNVAELAKYVDALAKEFKSKDIPMASSAFGVNSEYQWIGMTTPPSEWIWKRFINPSMAIGQMNQCNRLSFRFVMNEFEELNLELMPRVGRNDGIFASVNHHHASEINEFPTEKMLSKLFEDSGDFLDDKLFSIIIGN